MSTARMLSPRVLANALFQLSEGARFWHHGKERAMDLFRRALGGPANDCGAAFEIPLDDRARGEAQVAAHLRWDGDLALRGEAGGCSLHGPYITGVI